MELLEIIAKVTAIVANFVVVVKALHEWDNK